MSIGILRILEASPFQVMLRVPIRHGPGVIFRYCHWLNYDNPSYLGPISRIHHQQAFNRGIRWFNHDTFNVENLDMASLSHISPYTWGPSSGQAITPLLNLRYGTYEPHIIESSRWRSLLVDSKYKTLHIKLFIWTLARRSRFLLQYVRRIFPVTLVNSNPFKTNITFSTSSY